ncbi:MAG: hypothetical protein ABIP94_15635 [Planctomycetota bacterium]
MRSTLLMLGATVMLLASGCGSEPSKTPAAPAAKAPTATDPAAKAAAKDRQLLLTYFTMPG